MEAIGKTYFKVLYNNKDISSDISEYLISIRYNDKTGEAADELQLTVENSGALWENEWYPEKGAKLSAKIGDKDFMLDCGEFEIDEIEIQSPPDTVTMRAISAPVSGSLRTSKSKAHQQTTLKQIVDQVAADAGLTVSGTVASIKFERVTQNRETDLAFLRRLAKKYGFMFSVRGDKLVFEDMIEVMSADPVTTIDRSDCESYSIKDKSAKVFRKANISSFSPTKKAVTTVTYTPSMSSNGQSIDGIETDIPVGEEDFVSDENIEDTSQGEAIGKAALVQNSTSQQEGNITLKGDPLLVAGVNFEFTGIGKLSGKYHIEESEHSLDKESGYKCTLSIKRVGFVELTKHKRKTVKKPSSYDVTVIR